MEPPSQTQPAPASDTRGALLILLVEAVLLAAWLGTDLLLGRVVGDLPGFWRHLRWVLPAAVFIAAAGFVRGVVRAGPAEPGELGLRAVLLVLAAAGLRVLFPQLWPLVVLMGWLLVAGASFLVQRPGRFQQIRARPVDDPSVERTLRPLAREAGVEQVRLCRLAGAEAEHAFAGIQSAGGELVVYFSDPLLDLLPPAELRAVFAHELGHVASSFRWWLVAARTVAAAGMVAVLWSAVSVVSLTADSLGVALPRVALLLWVVGLAGQAGLNALHRAEELHANRWAVELTGNTSDLAEALRRIAEQNGATGEPNRAARLLVSSHPSLAEMLDDLKQRAERNDGRTV